MKRVPYETMVKEFKRILVKKGFSEKRGEAAAEIFAQNSLAGVYSHGLNRFPRVVEYLEKGEIDPDIVATCELKLGAMERWDGHRGFGPLNAKLAMDRACELAKEHGIGIVDIVENRVVGMKSRGVYETPGGTILMEAHQQLEELVLDRATMEAKKDMGNKLAQIVYEGKWFTPLREAVEAFVDVTQEYVTGEVKFKLYKGNIIKAGTTSPLLLIR